jgi:membrane-bound ClpP family serine protease
MPRTSGFLLPMLLLAALLAACSAPPAPPQAAKPAVRTSGNEGDFGAVSAPTPPPPRAVDVRKSTDWPEASIDSGTASISCTDAVVADDAEGDGVKLVDLDFFTVLDAMSGCQEAGVMRLRYEGRIAGDFTMLVERVAAMTTRMGIERRVLDIDSSGGQVEDAIRAGDVIAESNWRIGVRAGSVCHSACVLILAAGDERRIAGAVGIHRIIRIQSSATSRAELSRELQDVHAQMEEYLQRNGAAVAVADLMMTVPNRSLRLLTPAELDAFGLQGANAAQDDLERIRLARRCGEDFVRRKDAYARAYGQQCAGQGGASDACALALRERYGFPDRKCTADSPMAAQDREAIRG